MLRRTDDPTRDDASELRLPRRKAELGPEQVHDADALRGLEHGSRLGEVAGERLLAHDVLARSQRLEDDAGVGERWRGHRDQVDAWQGERLA